MSFYNMRYMEKDKDKDKNVGESRKMTENAGGRGPNALRYH